MIHKASDHLALIEKEFQIDETLGWDSYWKKERSRVERRLGESALGGWVYMFWIFIVVVNVLAAFVCLYR